MQLDLYIDFKIFIARKRGYKINLVINLPKIETFLILLFKITSNLTLYN